MKTYRITVEITTEAWHWDYWICDMMNSNVDPTSEAWHCNVEEVVLNADHVREITANTETTA